MKVECKAKEDDDSDLHLLSTRKSNLDICEGDRRRVRAAAAFNYFRYLSLVEDARD